MAVARMNVFQRICDGTRSTVQRRVAAEAIAAASVGRSRDRSVLMEAARLLTSNADEIAILEELLGGGDIVQRVITLMTTATSLVFFVKGHSMGDGEDSEWVCEAVTSFDQGLAMADKLNQLATRYGQSIAKPDLVGLEPNERDELSSHVNIIDPNVRVGRHGTRWSVASVSLRR